MLNIEGGVELRIVRLNRSPSSDGRLHQTTCASSRTARAARGAASPCSRSAAAKTADASARSALNQTAGNAARGGAGRGAKNVSVGDIQVVARDCQVEVVLEREGDGIVQRQHQLALFDELIDARRILQLRRLQCPALVGREQIRKRFP